MTSNTSSRRSFFQKSAILFGAGALGTRLGAQSTSTGGTAPTDLDVLNYALALENLEAAFYTQGLNRFTAGDFSGASFVQTFGTKISNNVFGYLQAIRDHEVAHVQAISTVIRSLGGTPAPACTYKFSYASPDEFIMVAMVLENTGVSAYDGAIGLVKNPDIIQAGASIATVEARHAAYLNLLNGAIPFPTAFDQARTMQDILATASQFIAACAVMPGSGGVAQNPNAPTISVTPSSTTTRDNRVSFDASRSISAFGQAVNFSFRQLSGANVSINGATTSTPTVVLLGGAGTYTFQLTVTDQQGNMSQQTVSINYQP